MANSINSVDVDPSGELDKLNGDFEMIVDPQDPNGNLLYTVHGKDGLSAVYVARIDGLTGMLIPESTTKIAANYYGERFWNGPEFIQQPNGPLGILYRGPNGVHGVFRDFSPNDNGPTTWNNFAFDVDGDPITGDPQPLLSTTVGRYPGVATPLGLKNYWEFDTTTGKSFVGPLSGGQNTDLDQTLKAEGLQYSAHTMSPRDGYVYMSASSSSGGSGIYEAQIDGAGGFTPGSLTKIATTPVVPYTSIVAQRHPVTGSIVLFTRSKTSQLVSAWEQPSSGGQLTLIDQVMGNGKIGHFRAEVDQSQVVLHYLVKQNRRGDTDAASSGGYALSVTATDADMLVASDIKKISAVSGSSELVWMPAIDKWALFYKQDGQLLADPVIL